MCALRYDPARGWFDEPLPIYDQLAAGSPVGPIESYLPAQPSAEPPAELARLYELYPHLDRPSLEAWHELNERIYDTMCSMLAPEQPEPVELPVPPGDPDPVTQPLPVQPPLTPVPEPEHWNQADPVADEKWPRITSVIDAVDLPDVFPGGWGAAPTERDQAAIDAGNG